MKEKSNIGKETETFIK